LKIIGPGDIRPVVKVANYFEPGPGASWGPRTIPDLELILVLAGKFEHVTDEAVTLVGPGQVLCIPPDERHTFRRRPEPGRAVMACVHSELLPGLSWRAGDYRLRPEPRTVTDVGVEPATEDRFRRCAEVFSGYGHYRAEMLETVAREIWLGLAERWVGAQAPRLSARMQEMICWLRDRLTEPVSRDRLARAFYMTPGHVNVLFRRELSTTPTQFVHRERVLLAHRLMRGEGLSAKQAAARVGFCDQFYFSRVFRKVMGTPPSRA
jgi:AraC-like DNA-binding protein